jgi:hypothetical protein
MSGTNFALFQFHKKQFENLKQSNHPPKAAHSYAAVKNLIQKNSPCLRRKYSRVMKIVLLLLVEKRRLRRNLRVAQVIHDPQEIILT